MARSYRGWLIALALTGAFVDQASKYVVFAWLYKHPTRYDFGSRTGTYPVVPGCLKFYVQYTDRPTTTFPQSWSSKDELPRVNQGALFGLGNRHEIAANYSFALVSIVAGIAIVGWSLRPNSSNDRVLCCALGLILAGTLGNLYDRIVFQGVRDFLYFHLIEWPVFNFADCCLVCGAFLLLAQAFLTSPAVNPGSEAVPASAPVPSP